MQYQGSLALRMRGGFLCVSHFHFGAGISPYIAAVEEHSLDDAFNNRIEVEEADLADDKMSYYSSQEMGKATGEQDGMGNYSLFLLTDLSSEKLTGHDR